MTEASVPDQPAARSFYIQATAFGLVLAGVAAAVLISEAALRILHVNIPIPPRDGSPYASCYVWDRYAHHRPEPGCVTRLLAKPDDGIPALWVQYNAQGLRGPEIGTPRRPRLLLLGDSIVEARTVEFDATMGMQLNRWQARYEILQQGSTSWAPTTEFAWFRRYGANLQVQRIFLFVVDNDFMSARAYRQSDEAYRKLFSFDSRGHPGEIRPLAWPRWWFLSRLAALVLWDLTEERLLFAGPERVVDVPQQLRDHVTETRLPRETVERLMLRLDEAVWDPPLSAAVRSTVTSIIDFARDTMSRGIGFTVVYVPLALDVDKRETTGGRRALRLREDTIFPWSGLEHNLLNALRARQVDVISLTEALRNTRRSLAPNASNVLYYKYDGHFTPTGHRVVAQALLSYLRTRR